MSAARDLIRRQRELEAFTRGLSIARFEGDRMPWHKDDETASAKDFANLPAGQQLLEAMVEPTAAAIREWVEAAKDGNLSSKKRRETSAHERQESTTPTKRSSAGTRPLALKWLEFADPEAAAYLAGRVALTRAMHFEKLTPAAYELGRALVDHLDLNKLREINPSGYKGLTDAAAARKSSRSSEVRLKHIREILENENSRSEIARSELVHIGMTLLDLLIDSTELFVAELDHERTRRSYRLRPTEMLEKWLATAKLHSALVSPINLPMLVRPRRWRNGRHGGYLSGSPRRRRLVEGRLTPAARERLDGADWRAIDEAVNHIQQTPWRVNKPVLAVMREAWDRGETIKGLPSSSDEALPEKPADIDTNPEALTAWKREASRVHKANEKLRSRRFVALQRFWLADKFADEPEFYFPHGLDPRGRVYPIPATAMHPQANDAGKALLEFAHGLPLGEAGKFWLAVHIANSFGQDKTSFSERVDWVYSHSAEIIDSALDPLDGGRFWTTAPKPWAALAASLEFVGMLEQGASYISRLPVMVDASSSGLQIFTALLRDPDGAREVNLTPQPRPADIYTTVARLAQRMVDEDPDPAADPWRGGKVTRQFAKRPTMTTVYSATLWGFYDQTIEVLQELDATGEPYLEGAENYPAGMYLARVLLEAIMGTVKVAAGGMDWLRSAVKATNKADIPFAWTTPDGLPVTQAYQQGSHNRVEVHWQGRRMAISVFNYLPALNKKKQLNAAVPNYVHSLDGNLVRSTARAAKAAGIDHVAYIHDSFGGHAANMDRLTEIIRNEFVAIFEADPLEQLAAEITAQLGPGKLPPTPPRGDFDINQVRAATYSFA